jgi:hypothetical protein
MSTNPNEPATPAIGPNEERLQLLIDACNGLQNDRLRYFIDKGGIGKFIESLCHETVDCEARPVPASCVAASEPQGA